MSEAAAIQPARPAALSAASAARLIALLLPLALLAAAFGSEYVGGLNPCEMCWWQRYAHIAALFLAAFAFAAPAGSPRSRALTLLAAAAIAVSGAIGVYHAGVELGIFEGFTTCTANSTGATNADIFRKIAGAPLIRCDQVQWSLLGISMAGWNAILSLGGAAIIAFLAARRSA
ncbi:MAG TPA: disulfide bond formation protein B [Sphingomicrobium sp.]|nr:disulfide bond formation protein B [Sphingomicrobium sp.]